MGWVLWLILQFLFFITSSSHSLAPLCHHHENSALLKLKNSFTIKNYYGFDKCVSSWDIHKNCCNWSGVTCVHGHVVALDLGSCWLQGFIDSNNSLFSLTHLRSLDLSYNDFTGSSISPKFGRFPNLIYLGLSGCCFSGNIPSELAYSSNLLTLDLSENYDLRAEPVIMKQIATNLTCLTDLRLRYVNMFDVLPDSFMNLSTSLINLELSSNKLKQRFPENIFRLPNLKELSLSDNPGLAGSLPQQNLSSQLQVLDLSKTGLLIDITYLTQTLRKLNYLYVRYCRNIIRPFVPPKTSVSNITSLDIRDNNLGGQFPWVSVNLPKLTHLLLSNNKFEGQLPFLCSNSSSSSPEKNFLCDSSNHQLLGSLPFNLVSLYLGSNSLNGTIPAWIYSLPHLEYLDLGSNHFTGYIGEFQKKSILRNLSLNSNKLHGHVPRSLFQLEALSSLDLSSNNLSGVLVFEHIFEHGNLEHLDLSFNSLSVLSIPSANSSLSKTIMSLRFSSCNISRFPHGLKSLTGLTEIDLSNNRIEGSIPAWLWNVAKNGQFTLSLNLSHNLLTHISPLPPLSNSFAYIDLRSNKLQGRLPVLPNSTVALFASNNQFSGALSSLICNQIFLEVLDVSNNSLGGNIPPCLGNSNYYLSVLDLRMNLFDGTIPSSFSKGSSLKTLNLNGNRLEGLLPLSLLNSKSLEVLDVGNNKLNDTFPQFLESLPELRVLVLRSNRFHGLINNPTIRFPFPKLRILDLSDNKFRGVLPGKYFGNFKAMIGAHTNKLEYMEFHLMLSFYEDTVMVSMKGNYIALVRIQTLFTTIDLSRNRFTGQIPESIGKLNSLKGLNFSHNKLSGLIPNSLGNLSNLEWLDLSSNHIVKEIPQQLASNLNQLVSLNLSNNKLEGKIPRGTQFDTFSKDSYAGNLGLCGFPLTEPCSSEEDDDQTADKQSENGMLTWKFFAMIGYGAGFGTGVSVGYTVFFSRRFDLWLQKRMFYNTAIFKPK